MLKDLLVKHACQINDVKQMTTIKVA